MESKRQEVWFQVRFIRQKANSGVFPRVQQPVGMIRAIPDQPWIYAGTSPREGPARGSTLSTLHGNLASVAIEPRDQIAPERRSIVGIVVRVVHPWQRRGSVIRESYPQWPRTRRGGTAFADLSKPVGWMPCESEPVGKRLDSSSFPNRQRAILSRVNVPVAILCNVSSDGS